MSKEYPLANFQPYRISRNPYQEKIAEFRKEGGTTLLSDEGTEEHLGKWREYFGLPKEAFLNLELGAYHGETSNHLAKQNPNGAHLGIEWKFKQCFKAGKKAQDQKLKNVCFLRANMARLPLIVAPGEVNRVWVLFPDPWSKSAHQKWRVLQPQFFEMLAALLNEGSELMIKTDHKEYAEYIASVLPEAEGFDPLEKEAAEKIWKMIPPTPFERIFIRQGLPTYPFSLRRNAKRISLPEKVKHILS
jgi:tRNA (guanine-N(7)-)-methyltransferase